MRLRSTRLDSARLCLRRCANPCNSFRPALASPRSGLALGGASYSVPVYIPPAHSSLVPLRQVIVSAIRVVFVLFVFVYFFFFAVVVAVPGQALFVLCSASWIFMLLLSGFVFLPAFVSFRFSPLILWLPLAEWKRGRNG